MLRMHGVAETGTATTARVAVECELTDYEKVGGKVESGKVESARVVTENSKIYGLVDDIRNVFTIVVLMDPNEDDQTLGNVANGLAFN